LELENGLLPVQVLGVVQMINLHLHCDTTVPARGSDATSVGMGLMPSVVASATQVGPYILIKN